MQRRTPKRQILPDLREAPAGRSPDRHRGLASQTGLKSKAPEKREAHRMASEAIADAINRLSGNPDERFGGPPLPGQEIPGTADPEPGSPTPELFDATDSEIEKTLAK